MKLIILLSVFLFGTHASYFSQNSRDSIRMEPAGLGGFHFYQGNEMLTIGELTDLMSPNELAYKEMKSARSNNSISNVLGFSGGLLIGFSIGGLIGGGDVNLPILAAGGALIVAGIPFSSAAVKRSRKAIEIWNGGLRSTSSSTKTEIRFTALGSGVGVVFTF